MRKLFVFPAVILLSVFCSIGPGVLAQTSGAERILSFHSDIKINSDSSMIVTETIKVNALGQSIRRGIYRDFPTKYRDRYGNNYIVDFQVEEVLRNNQSENYRMEDLSNGKRVRIGSADVFLSAGIYTYTIRYRTSRQLGFFKDHDELYWNVTGNGWEFAIDEASATVHLPVGAMRKAQEITGYTGYMDSKEQSVSSLVEDNGDIQIKATRRLQPQQGLTIVVTWPKGYVKEPTQQDKLKYLFADNRKIGFSFLAIFIVLGYYLSVWNKYGRDPEKGTIIPRFSPPQNLSPAVVRFITKMGFDNKAFTAAIIDMAVKGYLKITEERRVYTLEKTGSLKEDLSRDETAAGEQLFKSEKTLILQTGNHAIIALAMKNLHLALKKDYEKNYFVTNGGHFVKGLILSIVAIFVLSLSSANMPPVAIFMCIWLTGWTVGVTALVRSVVLAWSSGASPGAALFLTFFSIPFILGELFGIGALIFATSFLTAVFFLGIIFSNVLFYYLLKAPTLLGRKVMDEIEGFKMYLSVAEKDRLNAMNPVSKTPELFEKYLPYALALDVEQQWAQQFDEVFKRASAAESETKHYHPAWYSGSALTGATLGSFTSSLGNSFSNSVVAASTPPGSHSGSSGSGGGGSSGGGGGGGGGGGW